MSCHFTFCVDILTVIMKQTDFSEVFNLTFCRLKVHFDLTIGNFGLSESLSSPVVFVLSFCRANYPTI